MEEYIYILIGVIWVAASIYKATQKGKKKASPHKPGTPQTQESQSVPGARSLLEELLGGQEVKIPEPESREFAVDESLYVETEQEQAAKSLLSKHAKYGLKGLEKFSGEGESSLGGITFKDELMELTKESPGQNKIDLRKAIIYSAILERPYS